MYICVNIYVYILILYIYIFVYLDVFIHSLSDDSWHHDICMLICMLIGTRLGTCYNISILLYFGKSDRVKYEKR